MLLMGDEVRRTQQGNNNAYCQNNEISWLDWTLLDRHADIYRFCKQLIALRLNRELSSERLDMTLNQLLSKQPLQWHGVKLNAPDWGDGSHTLAVTVRVPGGRFILHLIANAYWEPLQFEIPATGEGYEPWQRIIDTFLDSPDDICGWDVAPEIEDSTYLVHARSVVLLVSGLKG